MNKLLAETGMNLSKAIGSPENEAVLTKTSDSEPLKVDEHAKHRSIKDSLMYIANRHRAGFIGGDKHIGVLLARAGKVVHGGCKRSNPLS